MWENIFDCNSNSFASSHVDMALAMDDIQLAIYYLDSWYLEPGLIHVEEIS
jgi:hypothetical protein